MSDPKRRRRRQSKSAASGLSRRRFLKRAGAAAAGLAATPFLPGCGNSDDGSLGLGPGSGEVEFKHGVASGDPLADRVILWTRLTTASASAVGGSYLIASDPQLTQVVQRGDFATDASRDYTVKLDVAGLSPGTTYYYRFSAAGTDSPVGRTRTLPADGVERLRIGVLSCASYAHGVFNAIRHVAERADLDFVLYLGDYIYEYSSGDDGKETYGDFRRYDPPTEIQSLDDYRRRYAQYRTDADLLELHRQHAVICIWDDHETADNSWREGAVNHNEGGDEGDWNERVGRALHAYYEWMPTRRIDPTEARRNNRSFRVGDLAELVLIEERLIARDQQVQGAVTVQGAQVGFAPIELVQQNNRDMLGPEQESWLAQTLRATPARWKLLGHGVMLSHFKITGVPGAVPGSVYVNPDQWDGYPQARTRLHDILDGADGGAPVGNLVSLAADVHCSWCNELARDPNNPLLYNPLSGAGALAVEFVATSVTAPGLEAVAPLQPLVPIMNPQVKYVDFSQRGYLLLDITPERVVGEHWYVPTILAASAAQTFGAAFAVADGTPRLNSTSQTEPRESPPPPAP